MEPSSKRPRTEASPKPKLEDQLREAMKGKHYSRHMADAYAMWYQQYVLFHGKRHPAEMGVEEISDFLQHLCVKRHVAAATHMAKR